MQWIQGTLFFHFHWVAHWSPSSPLEASCSSLLTFLITDYLNFEKPFFNFDVLEKKAKIQKLKFWKKMAQAVLWLAAWNKIERLILNKLHDWFVLHARKMKSVQSHFIVLLTLPLYHASGKFHFRWLNFNGFDAAFPISITLFFNHLNWYWF